MKKLSLLLMLLLSLSGYSQFSEGFEGSSANLPTGWSFQQNSTGTAQFWKISTLVTSPPSICEGSNSAFIDRENIGIGNTAEDYLVTPLFTVPADGQLRFLTRQGFSGDQLTKYQVRISTNPDPSVLSSYVQIKQWTENEMNTDPTICQEQKLSISSYAGQQIHLAFVRVFTQTIAGEFGDRWFVDKVAVSSQCFNPSQGTVTNIASTTATLNWTDPKGSLWDVEIVKQGDIVTGSPSISNINAKTVDVSNLTADTFYNFYVRSVCNDSNSDWAGPFVFKTFPLGTLCKEPIKISALPYQTSSNTGNFSDFVDGPQGGNCGANPPSIDYLGGNDVFYEYIATETGKISIKLIPTAAQSSVFVYGSCSISGNCLAGAANTGSDVRLINNLAVTQGQSYKIVISSSVINQTIGYTLVVQKEACLPPSGNIPSGSDIGTNSAKLSWTENDNATEWEVVVSDLGSPVPTGSGVPATNPFLYENLQSAKQYQYFVRSKCPLPSTDFSSWSGPYPFNTLVCAPADMCEYTFRLADSANNGWNGATMQVKQNGILMGTIGTTYTSGVGFDEKIKLCNNIPFELFWDTAGTNPEQCIVSIINKFGQTIFTKNAGSGSPGAIVYSNTVNCVTPICTLVPTNLSAANITPFAATLSWNAPATSTWDIYVVPAGSPAPNATTTPTYAGVTSNPFTTTISLNKETSYTFYVRVVCSPIQPDWSVGYTFTTAQTCPKPTNLNVSGATINSAILSWINGASNQTKWDLLLVKAVAPGYGVPLTPADNPVLAPGDVFKTITSPTESSPYTIEGLEQATIYYYYIRTVCSDSDKSSWSGPFKFNTLTCNSGDKCTYKFILTDSGKNGWQGGRMNVRQNGIVVTTTPLGATITGAGPTPVNVQLCNGIPFDLFWETAGSAPNEIGISIQNPFQDVVYTKQPGQGTPGEVLFSSIGNCVAPSCVKPTAMNVANVTQTTATVGWTENTSQNAQTWEVYVVPAGSPLPDNNTPVTGVPPYYLANSNPYTIEGLQPGTSYVYYVRAICSGTDHSTWTTLNPVSFITKPSNDECSEAINVAVNPKQACVDFVKGNTLGATGSIPQINPVCSGIADDDVWFSFVATSTIHTISMNNIQGGTTDLNHTLYEGSDCSTMTQVYCSDPNNSAASGLTPGNTYKIRVYTSGAVQSQTATFEMCIGTVEPLTNDDCTNAIDVPVNTYSNCDAFVTGSLINATASQPVLNPVCFGNADDDVWFKFVANSTSQMVTLSNIWGSTTNLNHAVYSGDCGVLVQKVCSAANSLISNTSGYVIGQTYYVRVWSNESTPQNVTFDMCIKPSPSCSNAAPICGTSADNPYIFENVTGQPSLGSFACLGDSPNATFFTMHIGKSGLLKFLISQSESKTVFPTDEAKPGMDVDFVAWGPFASPSECGVVQDMIVNHKYTNCPSNPIAPPGCYPDIANSVVDCSFYSSSTENFTIPNAISGQYYILLITNQEGFPGYIKITQTNSNDSSAGSTMCCSANLGPDVPLCGPSVMLNATTGTDLNNTPSSFTWYFNGELIPGATGPTFEATQQGVYMVRGVCGLNLVEDEITVLPPFPLAIASPIEYKVCDDATSDGISSFDLKAFESQILGSIDPTTVTVAYYLTQSDASATTNPIDKTVLFVNTVPYLQTIYVRVASTSTTNCFTIEPVKLIVDVKPIADFTYSKSGYCFGDTNSPIPVLKGSSGTFSASPSGLVINSSTGAIDLLTSSPGTYSVVNTLSATNACGIIVSSPVVVTVEPIVGISIENRCSGNNYELAANPINNTFNPSTSSYLWTTTDGEYVPSNVSNTIILKKTGTYTVKVTTAEGCTSEESITVSDITCTIPRGISPDGDGKNDNLDLTTLNLKKLDIFNRYGTFVYGKDNYVDEWHGQDNNGSELPDGTYFYVIHYKDNKTDKGWIYINRKH